MTFFLFASIIMAAAFHIFGAFALYDLAIHYVAIGFLGITVALYLPLMLPPITGKIVHFTKFNSLPLFLIIAALAIRTLGDIMMMSLQLATINSASYASMTSGWLIVGALFAFVTMIHRSMKQEEAINEKLKRRRSNELFLGGLPVKWEKVEVTQKVTDHTY